MNKVVPSGHLIHREHTYWHFFKPSQISNTYWKFSVTKAFSKDSSAFSKKEI